MHHRGGHIDQRSNFVKDTKNVALTFGGTNNLGTDGYGAFALSRATGYRVLRKHRKVDTAGQTL